MLCSTFQVQQPGDGDEGKGHHRTVLGSLSWHRPHTDAGLEQRWEIYVHPRVLTKACGTTKKTYAEFLVDICFTVSCHLSWKIWVMRNGKSQGNTSPNVPSFEPRHPLTRTAISEVGSHMNGKNGKWIGIVFLEISAQINFSVASRRKCIVFILALIKLSGSYRKAETEPETQTMRNTTP